MTIRDFIAQHRAELVSIIGQRLGHIPRTASCYCPLSGTDHQHKPPGLSNRELRLWILNDEGLYRWARSEGVSI